MCDPDMFLSVLISDDNALIDIYVCLQAYTSDVGNTPGMVPSTPRTVTCADSQALFPNQVGQQHQIEVKC